MKHTFVKAQFSSSTQAAALPGGQRLRHARRTGRRLRFDQRATSQKSGEPLDAETLAQLWKSGRNFCKKNPAYNPPNLLIVIRNRNP